MVGKKWLNMSRMRGLLLCCNTQRRLKKRTRIPSDGVIFSNKHIYCVPNSEFKGLKLLAKYHFSPVDYHTGFFKTYSSSLSKFFWKGPRADVKILFNNRKFVKERTQNVKSLGILHPLPIPNQKWKSITMDFITRLHPAAGSNSKYLLPSLDRWRDRHH